MPSQTYSITGIVLRRTKLGESDVICSILTTEGILIQAVAKGARKPNSSFSSRLEVFSQCDLLLVKGKSLDIVKEARLVNGHDRLRSNYEAVTLGSVVIEALRKSSQTSIPNEKLYEMCLACLDVIEKSSFEQGSYLIGAFLLKMLAFLGFRPSFTTCIGCGCDIPSSGLVSFSSLEGGAVCNACFHEFETTSLPFSTLAWANALMLSPFADIVTFEYDYKIAGEILRLAQQLLLDHLGIKLKSLNYFFTQFDFSTR